MIELKLEVGRTYCNWVNQYIKILADLEESHPKYTDGFRFIGSDRNFYRKDGTSSHVDVHEDVTIKVSGIVYKEGRVCETQEEASKLSFNGPKSPHGWIQWKGTHVCMDIHCRCGYHSHIDAEFAYHVECPACHRTYVCNGNIELIEFTGPIEEGCVTLIMEDGEIDEDAFSGTTVENVSPKRIT